MSKKKYDLFEIIEDPDAEPQRKPKRKRKVGPIYIPWRWVIWSFAGGVLGITLVVGVVMLLINPGRVAVPTPTVTVTLPPPPMPSQTPMPTLTGQGEFIRDIAWANGRMAAAGSSNLRVYKDVAQGNPPQVMSDYGEAARRVYNSIALSPDGSQVAGIATYSYPDGHVESDISMWGVGSGNLLHNFKAHIGGNSASNYGGDVKAIAYSPDSKLMVTGAGDGELIVWDTLTGEQVRLLHSGGLATWALAFQPNSRILSAFIQYEQQNFGLQLWDIDGQRKTSEIALDGHYVWRMALSEDTAYMLLQEWAEGKEFFLSLWDVQSSQQIGEFPLDETFTIDEFAITDGLLALAGRVGQLSDAKTSLVINPHTELKVIQWSHDTNGFQYSDYLYNEWKSPGDIMSQIEVHHLHFSSDGPGSGWLDYIAGAPTSDLQRLNLATGEIQRIIFW